MRDTYKRIAIHISQLDHWGYHYREASDDGTIQPLVIDEIYDKERLSLEGFMYLAKNSKESKDRTDDEQFVLDAANLCMDGVGDPYRTKDRTYGLSRYIDDVNKLKDKS